MQRRFRVTACLILLAGCKNPGARNSVDPAPSAQTKAAAPGRDAEASNLPAVSVELVQAGAEPRAALRRAAQPGDTEEAVITVASATTRTRMGQARRQLAAPAAHMLVELRLAAVLPSGNAKYEVLVGPLPTTSDPEAAMTMSGWLTVTPRGVPTWAAIDLDDGRTIIDDLRARRGPRTLTGPVGGVSPDSLAQSVSLRMDAGFATSLHEYLVPFPEEPVGVGARWRSTTTTVEPTLRAIGLHEELRLTRVTSYELLALDTNGARLRATTVEQLDDKRLHADGMDLAGRAHRSSSEADLQVSFRRVLPRLDQRAEAELTLEGRAEGEEPQTVALDRRLTFSFGTLGAEALLPVYEASLSTATETQWHQIALCRSLRVARSGAYAAYFVGGAKALVGECQDGAPVGTWTAWDAAGARRLEGSFEAGLPHGMWTAWAEDGRLLGSFELKAGSGTVAAWWPDGTKRLESRFSGGQASGPFATWFASGKRRLAGELAGGKKHGTWSEWSESGQLVRELEVDRHCRLVAELTADGSAAKAGILAGDRLISLAGISLEDDSPIREVVVAAGPGPIPLVVSRQGKPKGPRMRKTTDQRISLRGRMT